MNKLFIFIILALVPLPVLTFAQPGNASDSDEEIEGIYHEVNRELETAGAADAGGVTVSDFFNAVIANQTDRVLNFINNGADLDTIDQATHSTALSLVVSMNNTYMAEFLLDEGANPNIPSIFGNPLHIAVNRSNRPMVELLLRHNATVDLETTSPFPLNETLRDCAERQNDPSILELLRQHISLEFKHQSLSTSKPSNE